MYTILYHGDGTADIGMLGHVFTFDLRVSSVERCALFMRRALAV